MDNSTLASSDTSTSISTELAGEEIADIIFRIFIYIVGVVGNLLVIFMILFLGEFRKITHWYVLQLAVADLMFLQTLPFRISETLNSGWVHPKELCRARQIILYFNYYASIMFLMIMAVDRYLAVCHGLSAKIQRLRSRTYSFLSTGFTWFLALVLCMPAILYSALVGISPNCICSFDFPKDKEGWCQINFGSEGADDVKLCMNTTYDTIFNQGSCHILSSESGNGMDGNYSGYGIDEISGFDETYSFDESGALSVRESNEEKPQLIHAVCYHGTDQGLAWHSFIYFNFFVMFVLPLIVISTCYILIVYRLVSTNVAVRQTSIANSEGKEETKKFWMFKKRSSTPGSSGRTNREKKRVNVMCAVLVLLFVVCWLPFHAVHLAKIVGIAENAKFCIRLGKAASMFAYMNSAFNPYLYNFLGTFKKRMRQIKNHKRMQSFLSATGLSRIAGRMSSVATSNDSSRGKRQNVPNDSTSMSMPNEKIALKTMSDKSTTQL